MVACKTIGENKRNQEKIKKFCLEEANQLKVANKVQPTVEPTHNRTSTRNTRSENKSTNWSAAKVRRVATQNQRKQQQQKTKSPTAPKNTTNWLKQGGAKRRPRTLKISPGEIFEQRSKLVALQNSEEYYTSRSFIQLDIDSIQQTDHTVTYEFASDTNTPQKIIESSDPNEFMVTSPDIPPVPNNREELDNKANENGHFVSSRSTRKIDRAVRKIQALKDDTPKHNNPQVIFLDPDNNEQDEQEQSKAIQRDQYRLEREQANLISIIPAPQHTTQENSSNLIQSKKWATKKLTTQTT